jgi:hypothetical protein
VSAFRRGVRYTSWKRTHYLRFPTRPQAIELSRGPEGVHPEKCEFTNE